jgi:hypothetical protein
MTGPTVDELVRRLDLARHPEGGWYRETYRSGEIIPGSALPERFGGPRPFSTSIYFLLEQGEVSALHRIKSDEIWHFHAGAPLMIHIITPCGGHQELRLGTDLSARESFKIVVEAGCWFGAEVSGAGRYSLVGCTVSPGFDFADFKLGNRSDLLREYPQHAEIINRLTRSTD